MTGEILLEYLERRLDNVVYRFGFAPSRQQARQLVRHGHILVNGRRVDIPSFQVSEEDLVQIKDKSPMRDTIKEAVSVAEHRGFPGWLQLDKEQLSGKIIGLPAREDVQYPIKEQLIVELYSK